MSKNNSSEIEPMPPPFFEAFKKIKRLRFIEPSIGILGLFFVSFSIICCFCYLDYRAFLFKGSLFFSQSETFSWLQSKGYSSGQNQKKVEFLEEIGNGGCDLFDGDWVWDENYPLYQSKDCPFLDGGFRCSENGRPDLFYTKWRWQPRDCNLPRFDPKLMLEKLRNKRVVFVGDSIGRNQWESLLCMLSSEISNKDSIYEVNGSPITKHTGYLVYKFKDYNFSVEYYRAPFLVLQSRAPSGSEEKIKMTLKLDRMDWNSLRWKDADLLVFNTGHWWNYGKTIRGGCYFQEGNDVKTEMKIEEAYKKAMETVVQWINNKLDSHKTQVFFRTYASVHFRGGDWKNGGNCHLETLPDLSSSSLVPSGTWSEFKIANDVLVNSSLPSNLTSGLEVLNVTGMTARRKDGHSSLYYLGPGKGPASPHRQDCSHWCLPGVPDTWNELIYALFLKRGLTFDQNKSTFQAPT